jgi:hypothetical protein
VDVSDEAKLLVYIWYFDVKKEATVDEILGCKQLPEHTMGLLQWHAKKLLFCVFMKLILNTP